MIKIWRYIVIPAAVFVVGLIIFSRVLNQGSENLVTEMQEATLPVVYMVEDGELVNELNAYTVEMDASYMRDTVTPVEIGGVLPISIDAYDNEIKSVSYEIRSLDSSRVVQQAEAEDLAGSEGVVTADLPITEKLAEQTEYLLIVQVNGSGDPWFFYTRIVQDEDSDIDESVSFVKSFHEITLSKGRQKELTDYMETAWDADNNTLQTVTLRNNVSQICWGDLQVSETVKPVPSIKEIGASYNGIILDSILTSTDTEGNTDYYFVEEYFRVRRGEERMYILDYDRTVEEIFTGTGSGSSDELVLGIRSSDVELMENETGTVVCFVQGGELWSYNVGSGILTRIFSFRSEDGMDVREDNNDFDIRIIRVNETGSADFVVYGYMNRGDHEGQVGVSVCHFDSATTTVEEQAFFPFNDSSQVLRSEVGQAMYLSDSGLFYLVMDGQVYSTDLDKKQYEILISDMAEGNYASSQDGRYLAWTEGDPAEAKTMHIIDLETGRNNVITAPDGYLIRPLGFLNSDCVYGLASEKKVAENPAVFPMSRVEVIDFSDADLGVLKTYDSEGAYVTGATVHDGNIYLERMVYQDGIYTETDEDVIYNREMQDESTVRVEEISSETKEREVVLQLPQATPEKAEIVESKMISSEKTLVNLSGETNRRAYYVYAKGGIILGTDSIAEAVQCADENAGVVIGKDQTCVWRNTKSRSAEVEDISAAEASGESFDLTGCTLDEVLYYVDKGMPVYGILDGKNVVITGYGKSSVTVYDREEGTSEQLEISDAEERFESGGNRFSVVVTE